MPFALKNLKTSFSISVSELRMRDIISLLLFLLNTSVVFVVFKFIKRTALCKINIIFIFAGFIDNHAVNTGFFKLFVSQQFALFQVKNIPEKPTSQISIMLAHKSF